MSDKNLNQDPNRPIVHFCTAHWMNDPNGLVKVGDTYHLFYQANPNGEKWDDIAWGHASSQNLLNWTTHPVALAPYDDIMMFSGSAIVDANNVSGLGSADTPPVLAYYTESQYRYDENGVIRILNQTQCLAYSNDNGFVWQRYADNPLLDIDCADFRDPKVVAYEDHWIMVVALSLQHKIRFYRSYDLRSWEHVFDFDQGGFRDGMWECPDFFPLRNGDSLVWVLMMGVSEGGPAGGCATQYILGKFEGDRFTPDTVAMNGNHALWLDCGSDFFAAQSFSHTYPDAQRQLIIAWQNNWRYVNKLEANHWPCQQSLPREIYLKQIDQRLRVCQQPTEALMSKREAQPSWSIERHEINSDSKLASGTLSRHWDLECVVQLHQGASIALTLDFASAGRVSCKYTEASGEFELNFDELVTIPEGFQTKQYLRVEEERTHLKLRAVLDGSSLELFVQDGQYAMSNRVFAHTSESNLALRCTEGRADINDLKVWELKP